ncbi:MAG: response regulator transcription factor [Saprospiraceae bacterium]|nr:response regulator transcription factor [Saprospiraceae bacterium]
MKRLRVTIADDHQLYTEALSNLLSQSVDPPIQVMSVVHTGTDLLESLEHSQPDLLLLDLNMPEGDGLTVLPEIRKQYPGIRIIVLTMYDSAKFIKEVFRLKGDCYFLKTNRFSELLHAVRTVMNGDTYLSEGLKVFPKEIGENGSSVYEDEFQLRYNLTKRELEILQLISQAKSNKEIADDLYISDQTVGVHRKNIMRKLSVSSTAGLIKFAMDHDL